MALNNDTATTAGWVFFIAALGMLMGMIAVDVIALKEWSQMSTPYFVGTTIGHISAVIGAFVGGRIIPTARTADQRSTDEKPKP